MAGIPFGITVLAYLYSPMYFLFLRVTLDEAKAELKEADKLQAEAHNVQTEMIQGDIRGGDEKMGYYVLFAHAQDTLMTIQVEINMTKSMLKIAKNYEKRLADLEAKVQG